VPEIRPFTVHIRGKVTDKWRTAVEHGGKVLVFSPFVTNPTAWNVLSVGAARCELYTVLDPLNFATGASSLDSLEKLIGGGVKLFRLDALHAKVMIVPGKLLSVGSQNLTRLGTSPKRLEASAVVTDPKIIRRAEHDVEKWIAAAQPVTPEMLKELSDSVRKLKKRVKELQKQAAAMLEAVINNQLLRDKARNTPQPPPERTEPPKPHARRELVAESLEKLRRTGNPIYCRVQDDWDGLLSPRHGRKFDHIWSKRGGRLERFVCFDARSMRWGWARICSTRISKIAQGLTQSQTMAYQGRSFNVSLASLPVKSPEEPNIEIKIRHGDSVLRKAMGKAMGSDRVSS